MNGENKKYPFVSTTLRIIPIQYKAMPVHFIADDVFGILCGLMLSLSVVATQRLFDVITDAAGGRAGFTDCISPLLFFAGITFGMQIMNGVHNFHAGVMFGKLTGKITVDFHNKLQRVDPARFEDTGFLDDVNKAREGARVLRYISMTLSVVVLYFGTYFISIGIYLFRLKPMLLITLMLAFVPSILLQLLRVKVFTRLEEESAPLRRENEYYQKAICDREYFKETRILGAYRFFHKLFTETTALLTRKRWSAERKIALLQLALNIVAFAGMAGASYMLFAATMSGEITVGAFAAVFAALGNLFGMMEAVVNSHAGKMNENIGKVANYFRLLDLPEKTGCEAKPDFARGVSAKEVSFSYPGREEPAVRSVSLDIGEGETIALVGENGAGKSTLVRLLTGIYRPSEGSVTVGGLDTAQSDPASVFQNTSGVFQKYQRYKMTLIENVAISETDREADVPGVEDALEQADADAGASLDDMLSPEFDGIDLSGGQWQRVAIARGLYRSNGFIVLDEPTAAIDPIEETRIYDRFRLLAEGKCAILVTHRLGAAKLAHRIVVMDSGEIVDMGTHEELLARPGKYADMWVSQSQWYER